MWVIRILNGPQMGQNFQLNDGDHYVGRSPECDIQISSNGVSKKHCKISVRANKIFFTDLNSSNGTFVNGVKIQSAIVNNGDRFSFYDIMCEIQYMAMAQSQSSSYAMGQNTGFHQQNMHEHMNQNKQMDMNDLHSAKANKSPENIKEIVEQYIENIVLPAVYKMAEIFEFKYLLGSFILTFILLVTLLSTIPMTRITQNSIETESKRRAQTIVRYLAKANLSAIQNQTYSNLVTNFAKNEDGVLKALIVRPDGSILAPASLADQSYYEKEAFVARALQSNDELVEIISGNRIGAAKAIIGLTQDGLSVPLAYSIIIYDMASLSISTSQIISLFFQVLSIAFCLGLILYFFLWKLIEKPILELNMNLDKSIKDSSNLSQRFQYPSLDSLVNTINSLLSRIPTDNSNYSQSDNQLSKTHEAQNLVRIFPCAALAIDNNQNIVSCNTEFERISNLSAHSIENQNIETLNDQALILSIQDLIQRSMNTPNLIASNSLEFNGLLMEIDVQAIQSSNEIQYYIFSIKESHGGNA